MVRPGPERPRRALPWCRLRRWQPRRTAERGSLGQMLRSPSLLRVMIRNDPGVETTMSPPTAQRPIHPDLHVMHAISGRIRLQANKIRGRSRQAQEVARRLAAIRGVDRAEANSTTGSITVHYRPSALDSVEFFAEIAAALGLIASGIEPSEVEALFQVLGVSPAEIRASLGAGIGSKLTIPIAIFAVGFLVGRRFG